MREVMELLLDFMAIVLFIAGLLKHGSANGIGIVASLRNSNAAWARYRTERKRGWLLLFAGSLSLILSGVLS